MISVRDWGIGIEPVDQRRIFDKFYRVARPENRLIPGTGLGLTLVDHIVRSHHGRIEVDSTPGAGSTFRIHLPLPTEESFGAGREVERGAGGSARTEGAEAGSMARILVIEDDPAILRAGRQPRVRVA